MAAAASATGTWVVPGTRAASAESWGTARAKAAAASRRHAAVSSAGSPAPTATSTGRFADGKAMALPTLGVNPALARASRSTSPSTSGVGWSASTGTASASAVMSEPASTTSRLSRAVREGMGLRSRVFTADTPSLVNQLLRTGACDHMLTGAPGPQGMPIRNQATNSTVQVISTHMA